MNNRPMPPFCGRPASFVLFVLLSSSFRLRFLLLAVDAVSPWTAAVVAVEVGDGSVILVDDARSGTASVELCFCGVVEVTDGTAVACDDAGGEGFELFAALGLLLLTAAAGRGDV